MAGPRAPCARVAELFLLPSDEERIVAAVRAAVPDVALVDDSAWEDINTPPVRERIAECGRTVGLWNRAAGPRLVARTRSNGRIELPDSDYVVLWRRSLERAPGTLGHGRWATSLTVADLPEMSGFVAALWKVLLSLTTNRMRRASVPDPHTPERGFRVGADAVREAAAGRLRLMADALRVAPEDGPE